MGKKYNVCPEAGVWGIRDAFGMPKPSSVSQTSAGCFWPFLLSLYLDSSVSWMPWPPGLPLVSPTVLSSLLSGYTLLGTRSMVQDPFSSLTLPSPKWSPRLWFQHCLLLRFQLSPAMAFPMEPPNHTVSCWLDIPTWMSNLIPKLQMSQNDLFIFSFLTMFFFSLRHLHLNKGQCHLTHWHVLLFLSKPYPSPSTFQHLWPAPNP